MRRWSFAAIVAAFVAVVAVGGAHAVDFTNSGNAVNNAFGDILRNGGEHLANSFAGEGYADVMGASISGQRQFRRALPSIYSYSQTAHYQDRADASVSGEAYANIDGGDVTYVGCPTTMCAPGNRWVMWDVPFYLREVQKETDGALGYTNKVSGFATGISRMIGDTSAIGFAVGYDARTLARKDGYHFRNKADTLHMALFGGTNIGNFFIDGYAGWSRAWNRMEREVVDGTMNRVALNKDNFRDDVYSVGVKASYVWILQNDMRITPSVGLDFSHVRMEGINERNHSGNAASTLRSGRSTYNNLSIPVMVSANKTFSTNFLTFRGAPALWTPEIRGGYVGVVGDKRPEVDFRNDATNANFKTTGAKFTGSYGTVGAGMKLKLADKYIFAVDYDFTAGDKYRNHSLTAMYGVSF
ncbi:MAG: autotransporter outer membrane beta-barrel domain-containing protein [Planctomycetaceae bacterium]|nr:autotransporter outer membrane beta-barrel domain-containing protein [Planctomycetaceae bacterium]